MKRGNNGLMKPQAKDEKGKEKKEKKRLPLHID